MTALDHNVLLAHLFLHTRAVESDRNQTLDGWAARGLRDFRAVEDLLTDERVADMRENLYRDGYYRLLAESATTSIRDMIHVSRSWTDPGPSHVRLFRLPSVSRGRIIGLAADDVEVVVRSTMDFVGDAIEHQIHQSVTSDKAEGYQSAVARQVLAMAFVFAGAEATVDRPGPDSPHPVDLTPVWMARKDVFRSRAQLALFNPLAYTMVGIVEDDEALDGAISGDFLDRTIQRALDHNGLTAAVDFETGDTPPAMPINRMMGERQQHQSIWDRDGVGHMPSSKPVQSFARSVSRPVEDWLTAADGHPYIPDHRNPTMLWRIGGPSPAEAYRALTLTGNFNLVRLGLSLLLFHAAHTQRASTDGQATDVVITIDQMMDLLGYASPKARRSFDTAKKRDVIKCFQALEWLEFQGPPFTSYQSAGAGNQHRQDAVQRRETYRFLTSDARSEATINWNGNHFVPTHFRFRPGPWAQSYNGELGSPQLALVMQRLLRKNARYPFLLGAYLCFEWRFRHRQGNYRQPYRLGTLLENAGLDPEGKTARRNPTAYRATIEKALNELRDEGLIGSWTYRRQFPLPGRKGWFSHWLDWTVEVMPPGLFLGQKYAHLLDD